MPPAVPDDARRYIRLDPNSLVPDTTEHVSEEWRKIAEGLPSATIEFNGMFEPVDFPSIDIDIAADGTPVVLRYAGRTFKLVEEL